MGLGGQNKKKIPVILRIYFFKLKCTCSKFNEIFLLKNLIKAHLYIERKSVIFSIDLHAFCACPIGVSIHTNRTAENFYKMKNFVL
jgi:hypothetical protein